MLIKELRAKAVDWEDIGIQLQVNDGHLRQIKQDNTTSSSCLREMLRIWLAQTIPEPSWSAIIEALEALGDEEFARSLQTKYYVTE